MYGNRQKSRLFRIVLHQISQRNISPDHVLPLAAVRADRPLPPKLVLAGFAIERNFPSTGTSRFLLCRPDKEVPVFLIAMIALKLLLIVRSFGQKGLRPINVLSAPETIDASSQNQAHFKLSKKPFFKSLFVLEDTFHASPIFTSPPYPSNRPKPRNFDISALPGQKSIRLI